MPRGKPWNVDEEKRLGEFLRSGVSVQGIAKAIGKTLESVQVKVLRLGLEVEGGVFCVATTSTTTSLPRVGLDAGKERRSRFLLGLVLPRWSCLLLRLRRGYGKSVVGCVI